MQLTECCREDLSRGHHMLQSELIGTGDIIQVEVTCAWNTLFQKLSLAFRGEFGMCQLASRTEMSSAEPAVRKSSVSSFGEMSRGIFLGVT